jgi:fructose-specific phosphotransferase system IIC component
MVFSSAMRIIGRMGLPTGLIVGTLAIPILLGSYFIGATCSEAIFTGSARTTTKWLTSYLEEPQ